MTPAPVVEVHDAFCLHPLPDGGAVAALRGLSLQVAPGERLVVHGPNGSGKTTLMRALAGEQRLAAGRITVAGLELSGASDAQLATWRARQLGQVDQDAGRLLRPEFDVLTNVALQLRISGTGRSAAREQARDALKRLGLEELSDRSVRTLSGGQVQRVAVCAALAHDPAVVLADEPTGELDAVSADAVYQLLAEAVAHSGATLVLVTHDRRAQVVADRVVRIRDGRISETWHPATDPGDQASGTLGGGPASEALVVDDRGWVRLPLPIRSGLGDPGELSVSAEGGAVVLRPVAPAVASTDPGETGPSESTFEPAVLAELSDVRVAYGDLEVIGGFGLTVSAGDLVVVAGRSGAGKSTLLRVLLGLQAPDHGQVVLDGTEITQATRAQVAAVRARCCAAVLQQVHLTAIAGAEGNLDLARAVRGLDHAGQQDAELLAAVGLSGDIFTSSRPVAGLSGGERQRLAVARALSTRPRLLVLDEPTSQLDEASAEQLAALLVAKAREGTALVIASHDPVVVNAASQVIDLGQRR